MQDDDRRAKDLVKYKEVPHRIPPGSRTMDRVWSRMWRRPAGSSARLWKKIGWEDPFAQPADAKPEHRTVYAAGRFVRLDQSGNPGKTKDLKAKPPNRPGEKRDEASGKGNAEPVETKSKDGTQKLWYRPKEAKGPPKVSPGLQPKAKVRPPMIQKVPVAQPKRMEVTSSGRLKSISGTGNAGRKPTLTEPPPGGVVPIVPKGGGPAPSGVFAPAAAKATKTSNPPRSLPKSGAVGLVPAPSLPNRPAPEAVAGKGAVSPPAAPPAKPAAPPARPAAPEPKATAPEPKATAPEPKPAAPEPKPAAPEPKPTAPEPKSVPLPQGPLAALPAGAVNVPGPAQVVPLRRPTRAVEEPPPPQPKSDPSRPPPVPGGAGDLFGGAAQEGRVRIGSSRKKKADDPPQG